jgi:hypothetical protein
MINIKVGDVVYCKKNCNILGIPYNYDVKYFVEKLTFDLHGIQNCLINGIYFYFFDGSIKDKLGEDSDDDYYPKFNDYFVHYLKKERKEKLEKIKKASN